MYPEITLVNTTGSNIFIEQLNVNVAALSSLLVTTSNPDLQLASPTDLINSSELNGLITSGDIDLQAGSLVLTTNMALSMLDPFTAGILADAAWFNSATQAWASATTFEPIEFDDTFIPNDSGAYTVVNNEEFTFVYPGRYEVEADINIDGQNARSTAQSNIELRPDGGSFAILDGSSAFSYHRNTTSGEDSVSIQATLDLSANDAIRVGSVRSAGTAATWTYPADSCRLNIKLVSLAV